MTDQETAAAIKALAHRILERDAAMRDGGDFADAEVFAAEYITAMRGHGWRHLAALAKPKAAPADAPTTDGSHRAEMLAPLRAHLDELNAAKRAAIEEGAA